jgi:hypothetical protein
MGKKPYPLVKALEELDISIQGIHLGLKLHLAHVCCIHILRENQRPQETTFLSAQQAFPQNDTLEPSI